MPTAKVKWYNSAKGYGFLEPLDGSRDVFFHISCLSVDADEPEMGDRVTYEIGERHGKPCATTVRYVQQ